MTEKKTTTAQLFNEISQFVSDSHALLEQGAMMELAGLDKRVKALCEQVVRLSQEERIAYADKLQELLYDLHQLGETLAAQRDAIGGTIRSLSEHHKANLAYRTINLVDKKKNNDG